MRDGRNNKGARLGRDAERIDQFVRELIQVGGKVCRVESLEEARESLQEIARGLTAKRFAREDAPIFRELAVDESLGKIGTEALVVAQRPGSLEDQKDLVGELAGVDLGLTEVNYALADTGTLALLSGPGRGRLLSLLPPVHVALLRSDQILSGMEELFCLLERDPVFQERSCITFITGPSRTADIELTLTIGVHGPQELHVVLLDFTFSQNS